MHILIFPSKIWAKKYALYMANTVFTIPHTQPKESIQAPDPFTDTEGIFLGQ